MAAVANVSKEKSIEYTRRWQLKHPEKYAASKKRNGARLKSKYASDPEYREKTKAYTKARYALKRDEINAKRRGSEKAKAYNRVYHRTEKTRRRIRNHIFREKYGITIEQYDAMLAEQNGGCAICGGDQTPADRWKSGLKNLRVDHCHKSGAVRGLLCFHCNTAIGHFRDDIAKMRAAIDYLERTASVDYRTLT